MACVTDSPSVSLHDPAGVLSMDVVIDPSGDNLARASGSGFSVPAAAFNVPVGGVIAYGGTAAPAGWLLCDGAAVDRTTYSGLFAVVGVIYGAGNGSTTFNLPNLVGRIPVGRAVGGHTDVDTLGKNEGAAAVDRRPKHQHTVTDPGHRHYGPSNGTTASNPPYMNANGDDGGGHYTLMNNTNIQVGADEDTAPHDAPGYLVVNFLIRA